ncbi:MAG TPA: hypothetical protein VGR35_09185 [Tepidisphaeraceae bacterium]|nr:hypothetical protein [Tepidisphaeraceae bacterium]
MLAAHTLPNLPDLTAEQAEYWVAAALAEAKALRQHDDRLYPPDGDGSGLASAQQLRAAWQRWADDAEALLEQLRPKLRLKVHVIGALDLDYAIGRARAMLTLTPEAVIFSREQMRRGSVQSAEEVRRELRAAAGK